jgi:predicted ABC-type ATPase
MQEIIIIAGPNGAGKTSFANQYLPAHQEELVFVNADWIAAEIARNDGPTLQAVLDRRAGRIMLGLIEDLVAERAEFMFETTLASLTYAKKVPIWRQLGYTVCLIYLRLPDVQVSIERVRRRVGMGGHTIPEAVIRRRFDKSLAYLEQVYKPIVDEWYVWDSVEGDFNLAERWDDK